MYLFFAELFEGICQKCVAVLCCRMSPLQKAQVSCVNNRDNDEDKDICLFFSTSASHASSQFMSVCKDVIGLEKKFTKDFNSRSKI